MKTTMRLNKELYRDGLRQLRTVGLMGMVVFSLAAVLTAVGLYINTLSVVRETEIGISLYTCDWILFTAFPVLTPVMTMMLFNFLNHRNASDFYHSIPDTRGTLYVSYCAAILTWILGIVGVSALLSVVSVGLVRGYYVIWSTVPKALFVILSGCVLVMGALLIAKSLTGTKMSNLAVTLMILFLPRIFILAITEIASDMLGFVVWKYSDSLLNVRYNVPVGLFLGVFGGDGPLNYWSSGIYTLILGIIYIAVGGLIFKRRKSESAGNAAITRRLQTAFRLSISLTVCLIPIYFILWSWGQGYKWDSESTFLISVFYVIAVLVYFIYELITTGKLRRFGRLCRELVLLAALNLVVVGVIWGIYGIVVNYQPDGKDIDYVVILENDDGYFESRLKGLKIRDEEVAEITAEALRRTVREYTNPNIVEEASYTYSMNADIARAEGRLVSCEVAINCGLRTVYRRLLYTEKEWATVVEKLSYMPEYRLAYYDLPEVSDKLSYIGSQEGRLDSRQLLKVYEVMRQEVFEIDFSEWYTGVTNIWDAEKLDIILLETQDNDGKIQRLKLPVLLSMEKTVACYFAELCGGSAGADEVNQWKAIGEAVLDGFDYIGDGMANVTVVFQAYAAGMKLEEEYYCEISGYKKGEENWQCDVGGFLTNKTQAEKLVDFVNNLYDQKYSQGNFEKQMLFVNLSGYRSDGRTVDRTFCISLTDEVVKELEEIMGIEIEVK